MLAYLLAALLTVAPFVGVSSIEHQVNWAGCHATVVTSDEHNVLESFYSPGYKAIFIGTASTLEDGTVIPDKVAEMVIFHEVGHCLQDQEGVFANEPDPDDDAYIAYSQRIELDADRRSADLACGRGEDGSMQVHDLLVWAKEHFDYNGDLYHGTSDQRIRAGAAAQYCHKPASEAP